MATRDRSQGFAFVYTNLAELSVKKGEWDALPSPEAPSYNFNKDSVLPASAPEAVTPAPTETAKKTTAEQIRQNLDRLQALHQRIHSMLEELNKLGPKNKK